MIIEALAGLVLNIFVADNATGQNIIRGVITYSKVQSMKQDDTLKSSLHEEAHQIFKDAIREAGKQ